MTDTSTTTKNTFDECLQEIMRKYKPNDMQIIPCSANEYNVTDAYQVIIKTDHKLNLAMFTEYKTDDMKQYKKDLSFWSNPFGQLCHNGEHNIEAKDLPEELQRPYKYYSGLFENDLCLCNDVPKMHAYLTEFKGEYKVALISKHRNKDITMRKEYTCLKRAIDRLSRMDICENLHFIISEHANENEYYEFIVLLPCSTDLETLCGIYSRTAFEHTRMYHDDAYEEYEEDDDNE